MVSYGTASFNAATFSDGAVGTGVITVVSTTGLSGTLVTVNGVGFRIGSEGVFNRKTETMVGVAANVTDTAHNLLTAILANATLSPIITGTHNAGVITLTSIAADGVDYTMTTSSSKVTVDDATFTGEQLATVSATTDKITITGHKLDTGLAVLYFNGSTAIGGLSSGTTYYVIKVDANSVKLATTSAQAVANDEIDITSVDTDGTAETYFLTPLDMGATNALAKWQVSNDGVTFKDHAASSVFISSATATTSVAVDFSVVNYRYLNLAVTAPATGALVLDVNMYMKKNK